jgi:hypothetical protein
VHNAIGIGHLPPELEVMTIGFGSAAIPDDGHPVCPIRRAIGGHARIIPHHATRRICRNPIQNWRQSGPRRTVEQGRLVKRLGRANAATMREVCRALAIAVGRTD